MAVFKRNGWWWLDYYDADGKRHRKRASRDHRTASLMLKDLQVQMVRGEFLGIREEGIKFREFVEREYWPKAHIAWSERERERARGILDKHLLPRFGSTRLSAIARRDIEGFVAERAASVGPGTVNKEITRTKHLFTRAVAWRFLKTSPCAGVKKLREPAGRVGFLVGEQRFRLLEACAGHSDDLRDMAVFDMTTGARRGEIVTTTWGNVNLGARFVTFPATKSGTARPVPMNDTLAEMFRVRLVRLGRTPAPDELVFPGWTRERLTMAFGRAAKRAGVPCNFHLVRHHAASVMIQRGASLRAVQMILGHKDLRMVQRYAHLADGQLVEAVRLLDLPADERRSEPTEAIQAARG
jgi:integrase